MRTGERVTTAQLLPPPVRHRAGPSTSGDIPVRWIQLLVLLAIASGSGLLLDVDPNETAFARNAYPGSTVR